MRWLSIPCVIVILGWLPPLRCSGDRGEQAHTEVVLDNLAQAVVLFQREVGRSPESLEELLHLGARGHPYIDRIPRDGWRRGVKYFRTERSEKWRLVSAGPDGRFGTGDDTAISAPK